MLTHSIKIDAQNPDRNVLKKAAGVIKKGGLVAFPTETVYGIGADFYNSKAIQKLYAVKKRPKGKPFTLHLAKKEDLGRLSCEIGMFAKQLIDDFWPGPLTLIFQTKAGERLGVRIPQHRIALEFISACNTPIVAPSANISGHKSPRNAKEVLKELRGKIDLILDGGETELGIESTVVDVSVFPYKILREGAISKSQIADVGRKMQHAHS